LIAERIWATQGGDGCGWDDNLFGLHKFLPGPDDSRAARSGLSSPPSPIIPLNIL
jgi:hypothetical protein